MFSRIYRTIVSVAPLRNQRSIEATKNSAKGHFNYSISPPKPVHEKVVSKKSLKCSAGVLFLQRQFLRNFCLLQQKDGTQGDSNISTALQHKQRVDSPLLWQINEALASGSISSDTTPVQTQPCSCQKQRFPNHIERTCHNSNGTGISHNRVFTKALSDNILYRKYLNSSTHHCFYSTSSDPKGPKDETISEEPSKDNIWTIPNVLTMSRICLTPLLGYLVIQENFSVACGLFFFAGLTDMIDGYIARRFPSQISVFGSFLDPLADKILISVLFVSLTAVKLIPLSLAVLVIGRDIGLIAAAFYVRYISLNPPKTLTKFFDATLPTAQLKPMMISKINTGLQLGLVTVSLAAPVFGFVDHVFLHCLWYLTATTTAATGVAYMFAKDTFKILQKKGKLPK